MGGNKVEQEIKVGDRVVGIGEFQMKNIDGEKGTVRYVNGKWVKVNYDNDIKGWGRKDLGIAKGHGWGCPIAKLRRITEDAAPSAWAIHITPSSNATHAVFKQGKRVRDRAVAHCNPRDAYDATTGAAWAFLRLQGMADAARRVLAEMDAPTPEKPKKRGMTLEECKPGMRVRFRKWEDMEREYCASARGTILIDPWFKTAMRYLCGTCATVESTDFDTGRVRLKDFESNDKRKWLFSSWMLEPAELSDTADDPAPVPQPTYKPGDRVRIVAERWNGSYIPRNSVYMASWLGKEMTVSKVEGDEIVGIDYYMVEDGGAFIWGPADIAGKVGESRKEK